MFGGGGLEGGDFSVACNFSILRAVLSSKYVFCLVVTFLGNLHFKTTSLATCLGQSTRSEGEDIGCLKMWHQKTTRRGIWWKRTGNHAQMARTIPPGFSSVKLGLTAEHISNEARTIGVGSVFALFQLTNLYPTVLTRCRGNGSMAVLSAQWSPHLPQTNVTHTDTHTHQVVSFSGGAMRRACFLKENHGKATQLFRVFGDQLVTWLLGVVLGTFKLYYQTEGFPFFP